MARVEIRGYKSTNLAGGTLIVSIPHLGVGSLLVTDFLLEALGMDQVACLQAEEFPPLAMLRDGKPRAPARIHADAASKTAVLRCEFNLPPDLAAPAAVAILDWAKEQQVSRIVALDGLLHSGTDRGHPMPELVLAGATEEARAAGRKLGIAALQQGILGGVPAMLLLEARFHPEVLVQVLLTIFDDAVQDARSSVTFANALRRLLPDLRFDLKELETRVEAMDAEIRALQQSAERAVARLFKKREEPPSMYG